MMEAKGEFTSRYHSSTGERIESTGSLTHLYRWHDEVRSQ
jgi:hypothetical protein